MQADRSRWLTYLRERSPLPALLVIALGQSVSGYYLFRSGFDALPVSLAAMGIAGLLALMRMMDELKDFAKDTVAHPERPLPRGLLSPAQVGRAVYRVGAALMAYALIIAVAASPVAGRLYAFTVGYAFLMFHEFFASRLLNRNAFVYALSHQLIVLPIYMFAVAASSPAEAFVNRTIWFALTGLGASFVFEVSRKLDPDALPLLGTYLRLYGRGAVTAAICASLALLALSSYEISVHLMVWPFVVLMLLVLPVIFVRPARYKVVEGASTLLGFVQMLAPALQHLWRVAT